MPSGRSVTAAPPALKQVQACIAKHSGSQLADAALKVGWNGDDFWVIAERPARLDSYQLAAVMADHGVTPARFFVTGHVFDVERIGCDLVLRLRP